MKLILTMVGLITLAACIAIAVGAIREQIKTEDNND